VAQGVADLAVGHDDAGFGSALDGVDDVGWTERNINVGHVVLMKKGRIVGGDADAEDADVFVPEDQMMVGFVSDGNGDGSLSAERKCEQEQKRTNKQFHL